MTKTLIATALQINPADYDMNGLLQDAQVTFDERGRHAVIDEDEWDLLWELATAHRTDEL